MNDHSFTYSTPSTAILQTFIGIASTWSNVTPGSLLF
jgi:hypothetical protein